MKKLFILIFFTITTFLYAEETFYGKVEITMSIQNYIASPIVTIICKNKSNNKVKIPKCYVDDNIMYYSYFDFVSPIPQISNVTPKYIGKQHNKPNENENNYIILKPGKSIITKYSLGDFYTYPDDMYSSQIISYVGPLGYGDQQFVYFAEKLNQYDFNIDLNIKKDDGKLIAEITYWYLSDVEKYYSKDYFVTTENLSGTVFNININGKELDYKGIIGDSFGFKGFIGDKLLLKKGDLIKTNTILNNNYDIPRIEDIKNYKIYYDGYLGKSNIVEDSFDL